MISLRDIKKIVKKENKRISKEAGKKIEKCLEKEARKLITKAARNADFAGRKTIKEEDIGDLESD